MDLEEIDLKWQMALLSVRVHKFEQKARRKIDFDKKDLLGGNDKQRYSSFKIKEIGKKEEDSKALITIDTLVDWTDHDGESDGVIASKEFGMIASCDTEDAIKKGAAMIYNLITEADTEEASTAGDAGEFALVGVISEVHNCPFGCENKYNELQKQYNEINEQNSKYFIQVQAYKNSLKTLEKQKRVLQGNQLTLEDNIRVLSIKLENTSNLLKHSERINDDVETAKKELQKKLNNHLVQIEKWRISSKNLFRLIDSFMSVRTKVGLGFNNYIRENKLGWDDYAFNVFTTNSEDVEGRPLFNRFAKTDSMKVVPPPLSVDYTSLSDHINLDESQISYGTKSLTSSDSKSVSNDFVSCDDSDKSSEVNTNDFASSDSSVKSSEPKPNDSTSCASTSSISTSENKPKIESNDCDFYEKQVVNKTVGFRVGPVHSRNKVNHQNQFVPQAVLLRTGKVNTLLLDHNQFLLETPFPDAEDEGVFDSGCTRSITDTECLVLSKDFKLPDDSMMSLKMLILFNYVGPKRIKREYSNAKTPQQNRVAERKNRTLIEAARTMLADSKLPTMFWTEAVRTACYVLNRVSKRVEETMNIRFLEEKPNVEGLGHEWYFDIDYLTDTLGYKHVQANHSAGTQEATPNPAGNCAYRYFWWTVDNSPLNSANEIFQKELARLKGQEQSTTSDAESLGLGFTNDAEDLQKRASTNTVPPSSIPVPTGSILVPFGDTMVSTDDVPVHTGSPTDSFFDDEPTTRFLSPSNLGNHDPSPGIFSSSSYDDELGAALNNVASTMVVSPMETKRINTIHPQSLIVGDPTSAVQTRSKVKQTTTSEYAFISYMYDQ
nr:ribonuclease H-like domain-containing protein [Tanacetum cinerariifolium]